MEKHHLELIELHEEPGNKHVPFYVFAFFTMTSLSLETAGIWDGKYIHLVNAFGMYFFFFAQILSTIFLLIFCSAINNFISQWKENRLLQESVLSFYASERKPDYTRIILLLVFPLVLMWAEHFLMAAVMLATGYIQFSRLNAVVDYIAAEIEKLSPEEVQEIKNDIYLTQD